MVKLLIETADLLSINEATQRLNISRATLYRRIGKGKIRPLHIEGRTLITKDEVGRLKGVK